MVQMQQPSSPNRYSVVTRMGIGKNTFTNTTTVIAGSINVAVNLSCSEWACFKASEIEFTFHLLQWALCQALRSDLDC